MRILHLLQDSPFAAKIIANFEAAGMRDVVQRFFVSVRTEKPQFHLPEGSHIERFRVDKDALPDAEDWSLIIVHGMPPEYLSLECYPGVPKVLYFFGFEAYMYPPFMTRLNGDNCHIGRSSWKAYWGSLRWKERLREVKYAFYKRYRMPPTRAYFDQFDYLLMNFKEEFDYLKNQIGFSRPKHRQLVVGHLQWLLGDGKPLQVDGQDVQVGNSAGIENNHIEAFEKLASIGVPENSRVIVPLSYGARPFADAASKEGKALLGDAFLPLMDFLPLDEYNRLMQGCGIVIMNQYRQQALGNIFTALHRGSLLYLNDTPIYRGLLQLGFDVRLVEALRSSEQLLERLDSEQVQKHRDLLEQELGQVRTHRAIRELVDEYRN